MTATLTPPATAARPGILAAASGIVFAVLNFGPTLPERPADVTAQTARAYLTENATALRTFGIVMALSAAVLLVFVAHLRTLMEAEGERLPADVAFGSGVVIAVWLIVSGAMGSIGGFDISAELPDAFAVQYVGIAAVGDMIGSATTVLKGTFMLAVSVAALRTRFLPRWLAWFGVVLGVMAIGGTFTFTDNPVTDALFYAGLFGFALWPLPAGIVLTIRAVRARRA